MISGVDTTFIVQAEVREHPGHRDARELLVRSVEEGRLLAIAPQVLAEFVHVVTDGKRFQKPLSVEQAIERANHWWESKEVRQTFTNAESVHLFTAWMSRLKLGRKRILDTLLAATYLSNDIRSILTSNARDFEIYETFEFIIPGAL